MKKILIVEDDHSLYKMYATELEFRGYSVVWEENGDLAIDRAEKENPALILLDIMLPGKDGLTILSELKSSAAIRDIPVFVITNFGEEGNIKKAIETGAADFLLKYKIVPSELADKVDEFFGNKKRGVPIT